MKLANAPKPKRLLTLFSRLFVPFLMVSCAGMLQPTPEPENPVVTLNRPSAELIQAKDDLSHGDYKTALELAETSLRKNSGPNLNMLYALFVRGQAAEATEQFTKAIADYRSALNFALQLSERDQAIVLYHLLNCYEGLGQSANSLSVLHDLDQWIHVLPSEIAWLELPARYAMIYTREHQQHQAEIYFKIFSEHLEHLSPPDPAPTSEQLQQENSRLAQFDSQYGNSVSKQAYVIPRLLYHIGKLSMRSVTLEELQTGYSALGHSQTFLYQSITDPQKDGPSEWSRKSATELTEIYQSGITLIQKIPVLPTADPILGEVEQQKTQKKLASVLLVRLNELHTLDEKANTNFQPRTDAVAELWKSLSPIEASLTEILGARPVNEHLTPEAQARQGLYRSVRLIDPDARETQTHKKSP